MRMRHSVSLLLLLLLPSLPLSAQGLSIQNLMQQLAAAEHPPRHFTELRHSELLLAPITLHGTLAYRDGRLIKQITAPFSERFIVEGNILIIEREGGEPAQRLSLNDYPPLLTFVTVFRAVLKGDLSTLQQHYLTAINNRDEAWQLQLKPRDARVAVHLKSVEIEGVRNQIKRFIIEEQSGDSSTLELSERVQ